MSEWIVIPNWEKFQHYHDRRPVWIKLYTELRDKDEWRDLTLAQQGLLVNIWIEYAAAGGPLEYRTFPSRVPQKLPRKSLKALSDAGFIEVVASNPLDQRQREEIDKRAEDPKTTAHFTIPDILEDIAPDDVTRFASKLRDHDRGTEHVLRKLRREAPFSVFADAYGALEARRKKSPALTSEVRYYVATVQKLTGDWKQETYL